MKVLHPYTFPVPVFQRVQCQLRPDAESFDGIADRTLERWPVCVTGEEARDNRLGPDALLAGGGLQLGFVARIGESHRECAELLEE